MSTGERPIILEPKQEGNDPNVLLRTAGAVAVVVGSVWGLTALAGGEDSNADYGWHPVDQKSKEVCINPETGEWELSGSAKSSEAATDPRMNFVNLWADHPVLGQMVTTGATSENPRASMSARFDGSINSATIGADVEYPGAPGENDGDDTVEFKGHKPDGCEPEPVDSTSPETSEPVDSTSPETSEPVDSTSSTTTTTTTTSTTVAPTTVVVTSAPPTLPPTTVAVTTTTAAATTTTTEVPTPATAGPGN